MKKRHRWDSWQTLSYGLTILASIAFIGFGHFLLQTDRPHRATQRTHPATVQQVTNRTVEETAFGQERLIQETKVFFDARITRGRLRHAQVTAVQHVDDFIAVNPNEVSAGDRVLISENPDPEQVEPAFVFVEYDRSRILIGLGLFFFIALVALGRRKGLSTMLSLTFTLLAIFLVFIPALLQGRNIYQMTLLVSVFIVFMSLLLINGANRKSLCAILGNLGGLLVAGLLAFLMARLANLSGLVSEESIYLLFLEDSPQLDLVAIVWSGIVIGALGAVMDVAMSVASAMQEVASHLKRPHFGALLRSGLRVGADVLGTMTNTLILAYVGSSLALVLVLITYHTDLHLLFSSELIVVEILQALIGSLGILAAIPITSLVAARLLSRPAISEKEKEVLEKWRRQGRPKSK